MDSAPSTPPAWRRARRRCSWRSAAAGVGPGDDVLVPAFTAVPTASAVVAAGATPVAVDVDPATACLTPAAIERATTARTRAVIVVHLYGFPAELPPPSARRARSSSRTRPRRWVRSAGRPRRGRRPTRSTRPRTWVASATAVRSSPTTPRSTPRSGSLRAHGLTGQYVHEVDLAELPHVGDRGGVAAARPAGARRRRRRPPRDRGAVPGGRARICAGSATIRGTRITCACSARPTATQSGERLAEAGVATAIHYPLALTQQPAYRDAVPGRVPRGRGVGGRMRHGSVLPGADRGRDRTCRGALAELPPDDEPDVRRGAGHDVRSVERDVPVLQRRTHDRRPRRSGARGADTARAGGRGDRRQRRFVATDRARCSTTMAAERPWLRVIHHPQNRGYGQALISGFTAARHDWIFYTDGDAQYDAREAAVLVPLATCSIDVVQGYKVGRGDPWYRKVIGRVYHHVVKLMFGLEGPRHRLRLPAVPPPPVHRRPVDVDERGDLRRDDVPLPARRGAVRARRRCTTTSVRTGARSSSGFRRSRAACCSCSRCGGGW